MENTNKDSALVYEKLNNWKYRLLQPALIAIETKLETETVISHAYFTITPYGVWLNAGYAWDGASGPVIQTESTKVPSAVHDALCQSIDLSLLPESYRKTADRIYYTLCQRYNMHPIRAWYQYTALITAGPLWRKINKKFKHSPSA